MGKIRRIRRMTNIIKLEKFLVGDAELTEELIHSKKYIKFNFIHHDGPGLGDLKCLFTRMLIVAHQSGLTLIPSEYILNPEHNRNKRYKTDLTELYDLSNIIFYGHRIPVLLDDSVIDPDDILIFRIKSLGEFRSLKLNYRKINIPLHPKWRSVADRAFASHFKNIDNQIHVRRTDRLDLGHIKIGVSPATYKEIVSAENVIKTLDYYKSGKNVYVMTDDISREAGSFASELRRLPSKYEFTFYEAIEDFVDLKDKNNYILFMIELAILWTEPFGLTFKDLQEAYNSD